MALHVTAREGQNRTEVSAARIGDVGHSLDKITPVMKRLIQRMLGGANRVSPEPSVVIGQVFVPGGMPTFTYNPRNDLHLEERVLDYLDERHRILSLSGPTKSGKTVLLKSVIEQPVWISGGELSALEDFHAALADRLGVFTDEQRVDGQHEGSTDTATAGITIAPMGVGMSAGGSVASTSTTSRSWTASRRRTNWLATRQQLENQKPVVVIDDFHYVPQDVQLAIVRGLKDLIFSGLPVVLASVPHRAFDAVRVEKEMTGRVVQLPIEFWSDDELMGIAEKGFDVLNVNAAPEVTSTLARESFGSPHLMQEFCLQLCKQNQVRLRQASPATLHGGDWTKFFTGRASETSKAAFDLLARGPRQRTDRKQRVLRDGRVMDIYGAVLAAIAHTGPRTTLTYEQLRASLRELLDDPPQRHEVTRVLEEMSRIARESIEGEPVVDYDEKMSTLYIADPFFAYYLRWGARDLPRVKSE
jgi:hypothetical protein